MRYSFTFYTLGCLFGADQCITRCFLGFILSIIWGFFISPYIFSHIKKRSIGQIERGKEIVRDLADLHASKVGTPTMGGLAIFLSAFLPILLLVKFNFYVLTILFVCISFGFLGFADDFLKVSRKNTNGVKGRIKLLVQGIVSFSLFILIYIHFDNHIVSLTSPAIKFNSVTIVSFLLLLIFVFFVLAGASNSVNVTDGLDGLASVSLLPNFIFFGILAIIIGSQNFSEIFGINYLPGADELAVIFACFTGALIVFLWYNSYPASVMMGDVGSLMLGGLLGAGALLLMKPFFLLLTGVIFVIEALSDIIQISSLKFRKKKGVFLMAPIHHHFELLGMCEQKIVVRAGLISMCACIIALIILVLC